MCVWGGDDTHGRAQLAAAFALAEPLCAELMKNAAWSHNLDPILCRLVDACAELVTAAKTRAMARYGGVAPCRAFPQPDRWVAHAAAPARPPVEPSGS